MSCLAIAGCGDDSDASSDAGHDAGRSDSGEPVVDDSGVAKDSGTAKDSGATKDDAGDVDDAGGGSDAGGALFSGETLRIVYAGEKIGIDSRPADVTLLPNGALVAYTAILGGTPSTDETPTSGTTSPTDLFVDQHVVVGRLHDGKLGGKFYLELPSFGEDEGFHYAVGVEDETLPASGTASFSKLIAATKPTLKGGAANPGTITGTAKVTYAGNDTKVAVDLTVEVDGESYELTTTGGLADPSTSELTGGEFGIGGSPLKINNTGAACTGNTANCNVFIGGLFLGENEERLALNVSINGSGDGGDGIHAVIVLSK